MNIAIAFIAFVVVALVGWAIAELNYKNFSYDEDKPAHADPTARPADAPELNIRDIMRDNSTKGYKAI